MKRFYTFFLFLNVFVVVTNAQSLTPGAITTDPSNHSLLTQRFIVSSGKTPAQQVYVGPSDATVASRSRRNSLSFKKNIHFIVSYSTASATFSNTIQVLDDSGKVVSSKVALVAANHYLEASKAGELARMNYMELALFLGSDQTSAAITDLRLNEREITGSYVGMHYSSITWHMINPDLSHDFILTGNLVQDGQFAAASDSNCVELNFGYSRTLTAEQLSVFWGDLNVQQKNTADVINWTTEKEQNNHHFIVEKGNDGINFNGIALVNAAGTTGAASYNFEDQDMTDAVAYYRIKQIDVEGHYNYSTVVKVVNTTAVARLDRQKAIYASAK